jgi:hypothetical protein
MLSSQPSCSAGKGRGLLLHARAGPHPLACGGGLSPLGRLPPLSHVLGRHLLYSVRGRGHAAGLRGMRGFKTLKPFVGTHRLLDGSHRAGRHSRRARGRSLPRVQRVRGGGDLPSLVEALRRWGGGRAHGARGATFGGGIGGKELGAGPHRWPAGHAPRGRCPVGRGWVCRAWRVWVSRVRRGRGSRAWRGWGSLGACWMASPSSW